MSSDAEGWFEFDRRLFWSKVTRYARAYYLREKPRASWELADEYKLPERYNDAYHVAGDGVCVPAVRHIAAHLLEPLLQVANPEARPLAAE